MHDLQDSTAAKRTAEDTASPARLGKWRASLYAIMLEGELVLVLDSGETTVRAGDVIVQRGTSHAWANRSAANARIAFVLVDGRFEAGLG